MRSRTRSTSGALMLLVTMVVPSGPSRADQSAMSRGAYLARITGRIGCHSPRKPAGGVQEDKLLSGGDHPIPADGGRIRIFPPNIAPDPETGVGKWQVSDIAKVIKTGTTRDGRVLSSAMPWRSQFQTMEDGDPTAIAVYLKSVPAIGHSVPAPVTADAKLPAQHASGAAHGQISR